MPNAHERYKNAIGTTFVEMNDDIITIEENSRRHFWTPRKNYMINNIYIYIMLFFYLCIHILLHEIGYHRLRQAHHSHRPIVGS